MAVIIKGKSQRVLFTAYTTKRTLDIFNDWAGDKPVRGMLLDEIVERIMLLDSDATKAFEKFVELSQRKE